MKTSTLKLKKFKATRVYGFKNDRKLSGPFAMETPNITTTTTTSSGIML